MRAFAVPLLIVAFLLPARAGAEIAVWAQPLPMFLLGPSLQESLQHPQLRSFSVGANIATAGKALVVETLIAPGSRTNECGTMKYWGGWASVGLLIPLGKSVMDGFFIQPKIIGTYFNQTNEGGCVDVANLNWSTAEWDVGVDLGFQVTFGPIYVAPVLGVFAGQCFNCAQSGLPSAPYFLDDAASGLQRFNFGFNLNLLRVGAVW